MGDGGWCGRGGEEGRGGGGIGGIRGFSCQMESIPKKTVPKKAEIWGHEEEGFTSKSAAPNATGVDIMGSTSRTTTRKHRSTRTMLTPPK